VLVSISADAILFYSLQTKIHHNKIFTVNQEYAFLMPKMCKYFWHVTAHRSYIYTVRVPIQVWKQWGKEMMGM
jgi:hypothetical protein